MTDNIRFRIKQMIVERLFLNISPQDIADDAALVETLGLDSIRLFEIAIGLETEFDIDLSSEPFDMANFATIIKLEDVVKRLKK